MSNNRISVSIGNGRSEEEEEEVVDGKLPKKRQKIAASAPLHGAESGQQKQNQKQKQRKKRRICDRCHRPVPQTCLCESLPETRISLATTEVVVLQHPLELKNHKAASHRSLPLLELCLDSSSLVLRTGRRFGKESLGDEIISKLWGKHNSAITKSTSTSTTTLTSTTISYLPVLVFPKINIETCAKDSKETEAKYHEDESTVLSLQQLVERWKEDTKTNNTRKPKILLLVLDATWKHAREMHLANIRADQYPPHMLRLALQPQDFQGGFVSGRFRLRGKAPKTGYKQQQKHGNNNDEASSIDETWMSTAECIAWIISNLEANHEQDKTEEASQSLYEILMKPLDSMVAKWNSFRKSNNQKNKRSSLEKKSNDIPESQSHIASSNEKVS